MHPERSLRPQPEPLRTTARTALVLTGLLLCLPDLGVGQTPSTDIFLMSMRTRDGEVSLGRPTNITEREGYDNQPSFLPNGRSILYTSNREGQTDIYRYYVATRATMQVTDTRPESEYSPTVMPNGETFSVIRVEADSTQRLWQFDLDGRNPRLVLTDIAPVGYHAWSDAITLGLFVLGNPPTLQLADTRSGTAIIIAYAIGRSLHAIPNRNAISFSHRIPELWIKELDLETNAVRPLLPLLEGNEFYVWTPDGAVLTGQGSKLYRWNPDQDDTWQEIADLAESDIDNMSRLAVSPDGEWLAVVATGVGDSSS